MEAIDLPYIKGVNFGYITQRGKFADEKAKESMRIMAEETGANTVVLIVMGYQETAHSEEIFFKGSPVPKKEEVVEMIDFAKTLGLKVILKPMLNCIDGTWRAYINFFDIDVPCESKWCNWFRNYNQFILYYAQIAEETRCDGFVVGTELVMSQRRETEWRALIGKVRDTYKGLLIYSTDKYQEGEVSWWDAVDVISASGYYPIDAWEKELIRIKSVVERYNKPFVLMQVGCMSSKGSSLEPNNWQLEEHLDIEEQAQYFIEMFEKCKQHPWVRGFGIWQWNTHLYKKEFGAKQVGHEVYGKPACKVIKDFYNEMN